MTDQLDRLKAALADRYSIERELGTGGMATVYLAEDLKHKRKVAVKVLRPELAAVLGAERFVQEITTTANLQPVGRGSTGCSTDLGQTFGQRTVPTTHQHRRKPATRVDTGRSVGGVSVESRSEPRYLCSKGGRERSVQIVAGLGTKY